MIPIVIFSLYIALIIGWLLHSQLSQRRFSSLSFEQLLSKLEPVTRDEIPEDWANHGSNATETIRRMKSNCTVMIALALYCDNWSPQCCADTVIAMRNHEINLRQAANKYKAAVLFRMTERRSLSYRQISREYREVVQCLLDLYKMTHVARYPHLRIACT